MNGNKALKEAIKFYIAVFVVSWAIFLPTAYLANKNLIDNSTMMILILIGTFVPSVMAFIFVAKKGGKDGVKAFLKRSFQFKLGKWYLPIILIVPIAFLLAHLINTANGVPFPEMETNPIVILVIFLAQLFITGSLGEEFGWSGYALPLLREKFSWATSGIIAGALWAVWHLPGFWIVGTSQYYLPFSQFIISIIISSMLISWIQSHNKNTLVPALILHAYVNTIFEIAPLVEMKENGDYTPWIIFNIILAFVIVGIVIIDTLKKRKSSYIEN